MMLSLRGIFRGNCTNAVKQKVGVLSEDIGDAGDGNFVVIHQNPLERVSTVNSITHNHGTNLVTTKTSIGEVVARVHGSLVNDDGG